MESEMSEPSGVCEQSSVKPKMWGELKVEEKIERQREIIKALKKELDGEKDRFRRLERDFRTHEHSGDKIVVELKNTGNLVPFNRYDTPNTDEVYF
jgi:predicted RNase H-like nuclease (RuvC/YqgF family)